LNLELELLYFFLLILMLLCKFSILYSSTLFNDFNSSFPLWFFLLILHLSKLQLFLLLYNLKSIYIAFYIVLHCNLSQRFYFIHHMGFKCLAFLSHSHCVFNFRLEFVNLFDDDLVFFTISRHISRHLVFASCLNVKNSFHSFITILLLVFKTLLFSFKKTESLCTLSYLLLKF